MTDPHDRQIGAAMVLTADTDAAAVAAEPAWRGRFDALADHWFVSLATRRRSGWIVPTTVWFAVEDDTVYVNTDQRSAKVKRIRSDPRVTLCPCTARGRLLGQAIEGLASIVPTEQRARADALLQAKYRWQRTVFASMHRERMRYSELIAIVPRSYEPL